jgi:glucose/arabinose dehydrogenase
MASRDPLRAAPAGDRRARKILIAAVGVAAVVLVTLALVRSAGYGPFSGPTLLPSRASPATASGGAFDPRTVAVTLEPLATGLAAPLGIANAGDGSDRLFVAEQGGRIRVVRDGQVVPAPFLDISDRVTSGGERGLLGVAFHPRFPDDPRVFVDYTDRDGNTRVSSFTVAGPTDDQVDPGSERQILFIEQPFANHNGGSLVFDPGGKLLVAMGDGGSGGDPRGNGQSLATLLGKILRIDIDTQNTADRAYGIPADNPYADGAGGRRPEIWLTGLRNPWRISFDRATGDLWIGDVGQNAWEEVDVQRAGAAAGTNFGWNRMEGTHCFQPSQDCATPDLTLPVSDYGRDLGCSVIGGNVDRAPTLTALTGGYLFGDYCSGRLWAIDPAGDGYQEPVQVGRLDGSLSGFGEDEAGNLYAADLRGGAVLRVVARDR